MCSTAEYPIVDVAPLLEVGHPDRAASVSAVGAALRTRGFFYASGVNVLPADYIRSVYTYADRCHELPLLVKHEFSQRDGHGAYSGPDIGQAELAYEAGTVSTVRAWDYSRTRFTLASGDPINSNRYPGAEVIEPPYHEVLDDLYERQNALGAALMSAIAEFLGLPAATLSEMFVGGGGEGGGEGGGGDFGTIRLLHYPGPGASFDESANQGISPHTDFEAFTLMHQDAPGLQFIPASGEGWVDAPVRPSEFVVIVGPSGQVCRTPTIMFLDFPTYIP